MPVPSQSPSPAQPTSAYILLGLAWNVIRLLPGLHISAPFDFRFQIEAVDESAGVFKFPPIRAPDILPNPRRNSLGKITELHFHPCRDVALNLNNLAARYAPLFNSSKLIRDTFILR